MQAIYTTSLPATGTKPRRIVVTTPGGHRLVFSADSLTEHGDEGEEHAEAARRLAVKLQWLGPWLGATLPGGGMAWVRNDPHSPSFYC